MSMSNPTPPHAPVDPATTPLGRGSSIGRYVVLGLVGRGGMGEVYAAYDPELDRKVAVKLLRVKAGNGVSLTEGRQRTLREAQAIARLSHPNVVVAYDVGTFEDKVFIAMEFVEGNTVTFWVEQQPRTWREVLRVFVAAGRGLIAAHEKGLVHRDFKPDNVMVGRDGQVRVMDFGLARQMDKPGFRERRPRAAGSASSRGDIEVGTGTLPLDQGTLVLHQGQGESSDMQSSVSGLFDARLTRTGAMMGTPAYMAPEQFFGKETDARTDQFSFCVSLYEALYGERPFPGKKLTELTANVVQGTVRDAPAGTKVPFWVRRILLRGLRSAPAERFPSMAEMLEALEKDPRATRRKWAVWAAVALLPVAVGVGVRQSVVDRRALCDGAPERLAGIWDLHPPDQPESPRQSQIHAAFMRTGKSYAADVYETVTRALTGYARNWANMYKQTCEATQIHHEQSPEVLDLRMSCLQERLNGFRALTDVFADATGEVVENAVSATNALASLDRCADVPTLRAVIRPPDDPATVAKVADLRKRFAETKARFDAGRWKDQLKGAPALITQTRALAYQPIVAESLALVGTMYSKANDARAAEKTLVEAYGLADASRHDEVRAEVATTLVFVFGVQEGRLDEAQKWYATATAVLQRLGGHDLLHAWALNNLGCAYAVHRDAEASINALTQGLVLKRKLLGPDHPDVGLSEGNLGYVLEGVGRAEEALPHVEKSIAIQEKRLGSGHPNLANELNNRGEILNALGKSAEARQSFEGAISIWERELGTNAPILGYPLTGTGISYLVDANPARALAPLERALSVRAGKDVDPVDRAETFFALARALWAAGHERDRARRLAEEARAAYAHAAIEKNLADVDAWIRDHGST
jgi:serine/threonine protein kinase/tetratricopeptide (TPR) repeat protein